ncbi:NAD-dependent epimerase/dehydratase family protein [Streptomyces sp. NPDC085932]|uniref:NAD-dependent epimerase/dehydratase family protein n=1 Tax=Streptomyces sp. NPDC085932 TaxID=3365741 RepID=UPI0037CDA440
MSRTAVILGGTGQIGLAVKRRLMVEGWNVALAHRGNRSEFTGGGVKEIIIDRHDPQGVAKAVGGGADVVVDVVGYSREDAEYLLAASSDIGSIIAISTAAVYVDSQGRQFNGSVKPEEFPDFPDLISEDQPTVSAGGEGYAEGKVAYEQNLLDHSRCPISVLRLGAVSGPYSDHAREWFYVKRLLDGRRIFAHHRKGSSVFHTTSVENIAALVMQAAAFRSSMIYNCADPEPLTEKQIAAAVAAAMGIQVSQVDVPDEEPAEGCRSPWFIPGRLALDTQRAEALGYRAVTTYERAVRSVVDWLVQSIDRDEWQRELPVLAGYPFALFDYETENKMIARAGV